MTKRATLLPVPARGDCRVPGVRTRVPMLAGLLVFLCVTGGSCVNTSGPPRTQPSPDRRSSSTSVLRDADIG